MSFSEVLVCARSHLRLRKLPSVQKQMLIPSERSDFASWSIMLKKIEKRIVEQARIPALHHLKWGSYLRRSRYA